jgi:hypothetical protein
MIRWIPLLALLGCKPDEPVLPEPGPLQAGVARVRMPVPVGIGTAGFGGFGVDAEPTPFAESYPGTTRVHGHPELKAVVISRGDGFEVVFLRVDAVGVFQQLRRAVVIELKERLGRDLDDALVIGATHTHSGPGRVIQGGGIYDLIADKFFPEFYENLVDAMADAVEQAYADLRPARVGYAMSSCAEGHSDRRCEDGLDYTNPTIPLVAVERDGQVDAVVMAYAIHGTVLGIDELTLSQDVSGAIEEQVEDGFDHPVQAMMFNSWGADMAPGDPEVELREGAETPGGYDRMEAVGLVVSDAVHASLAGVTFVDEPEIWSEVHRAPIGVSAIGYGDGEFPYQWGGVYCGSNIEADCDASTTEPNLLLSCIPFPEEFPAPEQTEISAGRIGDLQFVTFPGEPGTLLAEGILDELRAEHGAGDVMFLGYAQDYLGYSILEEDWWQGGYEAGGALWGPKQGAYLTGRVVEAFARTFENDPMPVEDADEPFPLAAFGGEDFEPYAPVSPVQLGEIGSDVLSSYGGTDVVELVVYGSDPWLGAPLATLETADGTPVLRANGAPITSDDYAFWVDLQPVPAWKEAATERRFEWKLSMPVRHKVAGLPELSGSYRIRVSVPSASGPVDVVSSTFSVTP